MFDVTCTSPLQTSLQVDDDGESYWVFESRDVSYNVTRATLLLKNRLRSPLARRTQWIQGKAAACFMAALAHYVDIPLGCSG